jgi:TatD DNase family protein
VVFVDTHCHLDDHAYRQDIDEVVTKAYEIGVNKIIVPGLNLRSSQLAVSLAEKYPSVYAAVGVHPSDVGEFSIDQLKEFRVLSTHPKVVAIGEIGLDYYHRQDNKDLQFEILDVMLQLASFARLPVILHSRSSLTELLPIIESWMSNSNTLVYPGIFHAFEGNTQQAEVITNLGFLIGAGGPVTYNNAQLKHELFSKIDLSHIVLETDGPYLAPQLFRGKRNEPARIPLIAAKIAELQGCKVTKVAEMTTINANKLFNWMN